MFSQFAIATFFFRKHEGQVQVSIIEFHSCSQCLLSLLS